ncbi:hypothetical protein GCM10007972_00860 [Iodidimonas muriae]|uniref:DUF2062 domain-containing protein n=1 Tax=Iodidimonas muriae TaxID=261467 RepID=A0ABQ2L5V7_9PROT|nr:DUF2062 domain-containing protein [Iodidimonas muriae]GER06360.1 hypothetical protein JCM17843_06700 [Kordiimonadales bacterium JCM 17843]GGO04470.1 hypothetical protein GCM10007972_00860 [Iodidimonas muriae]
MLFRRKIPLNLWQKVRQGLWPKSGWSRAARYVWHRLARLKDSAHGVAAGVASGVAISFTPFMGFHLIGAMGIALAARGNVIAAWIGTLIGNPWTFPFIWVAIYRLGSWMIGNRMDEGAHHLSFDLLVHHPTAALGPLLLPMAIGGLPIALISWFVSYWLVRRSIERFQAARRIKLEMVRKRLPKKEGRAVSRDMKRA